MSSPCLSGGGRAYGFDLEIVKSPSTSARTSQTSSPSSTLSEASNSQLAICTRKCRTPRKRPNQTYNEAAALLSTAYPNVFSEKILTNPRKISKPHDSAFYDASELLLPFRFIDSSGFLLHQPEKPNAQIQPKLSNPWERSSQSPGEVDFQANSKELDDDFDAESILDEEIEEGIDSIMGNPLGGNFNFSGESVSSSISTQMYRNQSNVIGWGIGRNFELGFGLTKGTERAIRHVDGNNWWCFPTVDVLQISPRLAKLPSWDTIVAEKKKKKKKKKVEKSATMESLKSSPEKENLIPKPASALLLKLNYEDVANAWSDRGSPFSNDGAGSERLGIDLPGRLGQGQGQDQVELFLEGGVREASVLRYKDKRRTRLFSKKIRYQVRKINADRRPRMKGRFVRRPNSQR